MFGDFSQTWEGQVISSDSQQYYLAPNDLEMIERVLAKAGYRKSSDTSKFSCAAAFLIDQFQAGVIDEAELARALAERFKTGL